MNDFYKLFKKVTGLTYGDYSTEEYNNWYHKAYADAAKTTPYEKDILDLAETIIKEQDYPCLLKILENYDKLVKDKNNLKNMHEHPYWCYFASSKNEHGDEE